MLSILFLIPLMTLSILAIKDVVYDIYATYKYGISHHENYKEITNFTGITFYLNIIFRKHIQFENLTARFNISDSFLILCKLFSPVIVLASFDIFHLVSQFEIVLATAISLPIITFYYFLKFNFGEMKNELYTHIKNQDEKGVFEWIEKYKTHFLFKLTVQRYENSYFQNIYQKWELHKELQYQIAKNPVNIKRSKL